MSMHINLWEWLLFKTYMVYSTFLEAIFTLLFFLMEQHILGEEQGMECDEDNCKKKKIKKTPRTKSTLKQAQEITM